MAVVIILAWLTCGFFAAKVAERRNASGCLWFGLGLLFGPFGLAFAFLAGEERECRYCRKNIHPKAVRCPFCQANLAVAQSAAEAPAGLRCEACSYWSDAEKVFCGRCGQKLKEKAE